MTMTPEMRDLLTAIHDLLAVPSPASWRDSGQAAKLHQDRTYLLEGAISAALRIDDASALVHAARQFAVDYPVTYPVRTTESED